LLINPYVFVQSQDLDTKIQDVYKRIQTERKVLEASQLLRQATTNQDVLRRNDAKIKEAERSLSYFEDTLRELQARKMQLSDPSRSGASPQPNSSPVLRPFQPGNKDRVSQYSDPGGARYSTENHNSYNDGGPSSKAKNLTKLDLIKADTPHSPLKISRMLHQLEFKLQVEMQYKKGIEKMVKLYQADGDKKSRADAEGKRVESEKKIQLLQTALKRYKTLHVLDAADEEEEIGERIPPLSHTLCLISCTVDPVADGDAKSGLRPKHLSGKLQVTIKGARELEHAPIITSGRSRSASKQVVDTYVSLKVEGTQRARSHPSRTDRWNEEFEIIVDKANEVELAVYDKQASEPHPVPIALLWLTIQDLVDALRRQRVNQETGHGGWVTAGDMNKIPGSPQYGHHPSGSGDYQPPLNSGGSLNPSGAPGSGYGGQPDGVEAWFALEPVGAIALNLNFGMPFCLMLNWS
jgi:classical protein kinase C